MPSAAALHAVTDMKLGMTCQVMLLPSHVRSHRVEARRDMPSAAALHTVTDTKLGMRCQAMLLPCAQPSS